MAKKPRPQIADDVAGQITAPTAPTKPKSLKGIGKQVDYKDKANWCPNNNFCGAEHKGPYLHEFRSGYCGQGNPPESHLRCAGVASTAGRRKVIACICECHSPAPKKLRKLPHHIAREAHR